MNGSAPAPPAGAEPPWDLLDRYFSGASTVEELQRIEDWAAAGPGRGEELDALRGIWARGAAHSATGIWDTERALALMLGRMREKPDAAAAREHRPFTEPTARLGRPESRALLQRRPVINQTAAHRSAPSGRYILAGSVAAAAAVACVLLVWRPAAPQAVGELRTAAGAVATVTLSDGTVLTLGPATRLRVSPEFGRASRTVELDGEALFSVVHDDRHPFVVRAAGTTVRDAGTRFMVVAYAKDPRVEVAVAEGEVSIAGSALRAHDVGTIATNGHLTVRHGADVQPYLAWSQGSLVFVNTPLRDVTRILDRTYDLDITLADSALGSQLITATFTDQPANTVLDDITAIVGAAYERSHRSVVIRRRPRVHFGRAEPIRAAVANLPLDRSEL